MNESDMKLVHGSIYMYDVDNDSNLLCGIIV